MKAANILTAAFIGLLAGFSVSRSAAQDVAEIESPLLRQIRTTFQKKYPTLPMVKLNDQYAAMAFEKIDLKETKAVIDGKNYYAFRFQTSEPFALFAWSFQLPKAGCDWYILAEEGLMMKGFRSYRTRDLPQDIPNVGKKGDRFIRQTLGWNSFKPNSGYIIWFRYDGDENPEFNVTVNSLSREDMKKGTVFHILYPPE